MFIVKEVKRGNPLVEGETSYWGVFNDVEDKDHIHCRNKNANLLCLCYCKINAEKIAEVLNVDSFIEEEDMRIDIEKTYRKYFESIIIIREDF